MSDFWSAFGAIGTTLGSLITAGAVVIAVRQYKLPMKRKLEIHFNRASVMPPFEEIDNDFFVIAVSNIGIRDVKITGIYIKIGDYDIIDFNTKCKFL